MFTPERINFWGSLTKEGQKEKKSRPRDCQNIEGNGKFFAQRKEVFSQGLCFLGKGKTG